MTSGLLLLVYGVVSIETHGWGSAQALGSIGSGVALVLWFIWHEAHRATAPLVPLSLFQSRAVSGANLTMFCIGASVFASWYFLSLFFQSVLGYSPMRTGVAFLPQTAAIIVGAQISSRLVTRLGARRILTLAPLISGLGLLLLSRLDAGSTYWVDVFAPSVLITLGVGLSFTPVAVAATSDVPRHLAGLASGLVNTTRQVGGALGLAVLATLASNRSAGFADPQSPAALVSGFGRAFAIAAVVAVLAAVSARLIPRLVQPVSRPMLPEPDTAAV